MLNTTLLWLLLIPAILSVISVAWLPTLTSGDVNLKQAAIFGGIGLLISIVIMAGGFYLGKGAKTSDHEVWNGQITGKTRHHDSYTRSYSCMCTTDSKGNQSCQTCYEDHYTVQWKAQSTIGEYDIEDLDSLSRSVYSTPDPAFFTQIRQGEPCSKEHRYTNYIKAVPESLFRPASTELREKFKGMIPAYPINIYNFWHVDRVLAVKTVVPGMSEWNSKLAEALKTVGPLKQANVVVLLANTDDPDYTYAIQDAWLNGKKNDIIVIIGATHFPQKADFVSILALTDNELFKVKLRDDLMALEALTPDSVISTIATDTTQLFKRKRMHDFEYLDAEIDPPEWVNWTTSVLIIAAYLGFWFFAAKQSTPRRSYGGRGFGSRY